MKTGSFTPKPGDLFRWHYDHDDRLYTSINQAWSSTMKQNVLLCSQSLLFLVSITEDKISWLSRYQYNHARIEDMWVSTHTAYDTGIHPRKIT